MTAVKNTNPGHQQNPSPPPQPVQQPQKKSKISKKVILIIVLAVVILVLAGGGIYYQSFYKKAGLLPLSKTLLKKEGALVTSASLKSDLPQFAEFKEEAVDLTASIPDYSIETNQLINLKAVESAIGRALTSSQLQALKDVGFYITPAENKLPDGQATVDFHRDLVDEFLMHYKDIGGQYRDTERKAENAVFITSDLLLHSYHIFLDRTFQYIEQTQFHPKLTNLTTMLFEKSLAEYNQATNSKLKASFERLTTFFIVPKVILETTKAQEDKYYLDPQEQDQDSKTDEETDKPENILAKLDSYKNSLPDNVYQKAKEEIKLINEAKEAAISPLFGDYKQGQMDDYTQFKPRSHYTKNSLLRSYWKAMMWYGRNGFLTKSDELTLDAIIQTIFLNSANQADQKAIDLWENIYLPTVFFVGKSDDLTIYDYSALIDKIYGKAVSFDNLVNQTKFNSFKEAVKELAGPKIQSTIVIVEPDKTTKEEALEVTKSFRFMGQRFIPDSFIFSQLTQGDEAPDKETGQKLPPIPTALMPMSIFESQRAETYLQDWIVNNAPDSDKVIAKEKKKLEDSFGQLELKDWTQNLYWSWLYTLKSLFQTFGQGYPVFMQSQAWNDKDLNTSLGSWTELRHDTLLYAKQSYAEMGAGGEQDEPPAVPKGYVEPNLQFINRVIALAQMTKDGLEKNNVLPEEQKWKIDKIIELFKFYQEFAKKELQNQTITDDEFEKLRTSALELNQCLTPPTGSLMQANEARAGLIADVHTAVTTEVQEILYEATGIPNIIYVAVKDTNGTRLTRGVVYSYYEFTQPFGERVSDIDWQNVIYEGDDAFTPPQAPNWVKALGK